MMDEEDMTPFFTIFFNLSVRLKLFHMKKFPKGVSRIAVGDLKIIPASFSALSKFYNGNSLYNGLKVRKSRPGSQE